MSLTGAIRDAIQIVKLENKAIKSISTDDKATRWGFLILAIGGLVSGFMTPGDQTLLEMLFGAGIAIIASFIIVSIYWLFAMLFKGKGRFMEQWRPYAYAAVLTWFSILLIIPPLGTIILTIIGLWSILINITIIKVIHDFEFKIAVISWFTTTIVIAIITIPFILR